MMFPRILAALALAFLLFPMMPLTHTGSADQDMPNVSMNAADRIIGIHVPELEISLRPMEGRTWTYVDFEGAIHPPADGGPAMPYLSYPMQVEHDIENIRLARKDPVTAFVKLPIAPGPKFMHLTKEVFDSGSTGLDLDWDVYNSGRIFPAEDIKWTHTGYGWSTGERLAHYSISISPFDYDPATGKLTYYRDITLMIYQKEPDEIDTAMAISRDVERPSQVEAGTELLIIAHDTFENDLDPYVHWKREKGLTVTTVKYTSISTYGGKTGHQAIWQFIRDTYFGDGRKLEWVLLAGEPKYVPTLMAHDQDPYGSEPPTLPADTYFACLDGTSTSWDSDGDGRWGETGDILDAVPEVYVSRISLDTDTEALNWARKVVKYETEPHMGDYSSKVGLFGATTHEYDDGAKQCEYLYSNYLTDVFSSPEKYYSYGNVQQNVGAARLTNTNAKNAVNGGLSMIVYMGHGYHQMWSEGTQSNPSLVFSTSDAAGFAQSPRLPLISAMSCETNWFDNGNWESISEAFMENPNGGAIGYIGASRTTEGGIGYYQYLPGAPGIQEDTLRMMKNGKTHQAEIFHDAKSYYYDQWAAWFGSYQFAYNAWLEHNILGSPETEIWTNTISTFQVDVDFETDYFSNFTINVKDGNGNAVGDATVTIYSEGLGRGSHGSTDESGNVEIPFTITEPTYAKVTVTSSNFKPYQRSFYVEDDTEPETTIHYQRPTPDGSGGWYRSDPGIGFVASEPGDIRYRWNGGFVNRFTEGTIHIPKGDNLLEYWSEDLSGNVEEITSISIRYDPDAPVLAYTITPEEPDGRHGWYNTLPVISTSIIGDEASPHTVEYWWDRGEKKNSNGTIYALQGDHKLHLHAIDVAGNTDQEVVIDLMVDSIPPVTEVNTGGEQMNEYGWYTNYMEIELTCSDRTAETYYRFNPNDQWMIFKNSVEPPMGNNTLEYYSVDPHGNKESVKYLRVPYDTSPPRITIEIEPKEPDGLFGWYRTSPKVSLKTEEGNQDDVIYYYLDSRVHEKYKDTILISDGEHVLHTYGIDEAGNRGVTQVFEFKVDTEVPVSEIFMDTSPDEEGWITEVPMISIKSSEEDSIIFYSWTGNNDFKVYDGAIIPTEEEGDLVLFFYSMDEAGNKENIRTLTIYLDAKPPELVIVAPSIGDAGQEITFDLSKSHDGNGVDAYFIDFGDGTNSGWVSDPYITHIFKEGGNYEVSIRIRDVAGHESEPEVFIIEIASKDRIEPTLWIFLFITSLLLIALIIIVIALIVSKRRQYVRHHPERFHFHHPRGMRAAPLHGHLPPKEIRIGDRQGSPVVPISQSNHESIQPSAGGTERPRAEPPAPPRMPEIPPPPISPS